jgi:hypothetical protein
LVCKALKEKLGIRIWLNSRRDAAFERAYGTGGGSRPRRVNPMSGTGME